MYDVCIVDDEILIQQSITARLRTSGVPVRVLGCADNAESAIILYWSSKPDIFFVDINIPGMDGLSLVRRIRTEDPDCTTEFIVITGYDDFLHLREAIQSNVMDYLRKPIDSEEFNAVLAATVQKIQQERRKHQPKGGDHAYYEEYLAGGPQLLGAGLLLAAYAPSPAALDGNEEEGRELRLFLDEPGLGGKEARVSLEFQNVPNIRLYHFPGVSLSRADLLTLLRLPMLRRAMSFVHAHPNMAQLETYVEALEQSLNRRFLFPGLIECSRKSHFPPADLGMLDYALENGDVQACHVAISALLSKAGGEAETIGELSPLYRQIMLLLMNKYVAHDTSMPGPIKMELSPFALCRYPTLESLRNFVCGASSAFVRSVEADGRRGDLIPRVIEYLKKNYRNDISLHKLSGLFYVSPSYLSRRFKERTGLSFVDFLEEIRLEKAEEYLTASSIKITEISEQVGYLDPNYFSKVFKNKYNLSPSDYRQSRKR
jgi:two-component system, response regulator YesN